MTFENRTALFKFFMLWLILPQMVFCHSGTVQRATKMDRDNTTTLRAFSHDKKDFAINGIFLPVQSGFCSSRHRPNPEVDEETGSVSTKLGWIGFAPIKSTVWFSVADANNPTRKTIIEPGPETTHSPDFCTNSLIDFLWQHIFNAKTLHQGENMSENEEKADNGLVSEAREISTK